MKQLEIKNPCSEKWENMQGEGKEKLCLSCDRKVIDFQDKSVEEIIEILENTKERTCARLRKSQLSPIRKIAATVLIGGMLLGGSCTPKVFGGHPLPDPSTINMDNVTAISDSQESFKIEGLVLLENDGPAIGASISVVLKDAGFDYYDYLGTVTEFDGTFSLEGKIGDIEKYELIVIYTGYVDFSISLEEVNMKKGFEITLSEGGLIGELIIKTERRNG